MSRNDWTDEEDMRLRELYPNTPMEKLIALLDRSFSAIHTRAWKLQLHRSPEFMASINAGRIAAGESRSERTQFQPGQVPWNKGIKGYDPGGRSHETRFRPGTLQGAAKDRLRDIGYERWSGDGILERKIRNDGPSHRRWKAVHRILWEEVNGPIPDGHIVVFRDGNRRNIRIENLELISRAENARRNCIWRYPPELASAMRLVAKLNKKLKERQDEKQNERSSQPPVRRTGKARRSR